MKKSKMMSGSKIALTAVMIGAPLLMNPGTAMAEKKVTATGTSSVMKHSPGFIKVTMKECIVSGIAGGKTIFKNAKGESFYLDPKTGDMKFVSSDIFLKIDGKDAKRSSDIFIKYDGNEKVTIEGIDSKGNVHQRNSKGELYYIDTKTGDMKFVK